MGREVLMGQDEEQRQQITKRATDTQAQAARYDTMELPEKSSL